LRFHGALLLTVLFLHAHVRKKAQKAHKGNVV